MSAVAQEQPARTLESAIEQQIELGENDPLTIARKIARADQHGWLAAELTRHAEQIVADLARDALNQRRNSGLRGAPNDRPPRLEDSKWVPDIGWKTHAQLTADDCRAIAEHYRMLARSASSRARLYERYADLIETEGVETLAQVQGPLRLVRGEGGT